MRTINFLLLLLILSLLLWLLWPKIQGVSDSQDSSAQRESTEVRLALLSDDEGTRSEALNSMRQERILQTDQFRLRLTEEGPPAEKIAYGSRDHTLLSAITLLRADESIVPLVEWLAVEIDRSTVPAGSKMHPSEYFPAAKALAALGGAHLAPMMIDKIGQQVDTKTRKLALWVMVNSYGKDVTTILLERALASEDDEFRIAGLREGLGLLADVNGLLVMESSN